jgi:hypothetical protein
MVFRKEFLFLFPFVKGDNLIIGFALNNRYNRQGEMYSLGMLNISSNFFLSDLLKALRDILSDNCLELGQFNAVVNQTSKKWTGWELNPRP